MSITASDLILYSSANIPEDDSSTAGGGIDTTSRPDLKLMSTADTVTVVSDGADSRTITLTGRDVSGAVITETLTLNGTTPVTSTNTFERLLKVEMSATDAARTVTVKETTSGAVLTTITPNELKRHISFQRAASSDTPVTRYEKLFFKNNHGSLTLNDAKVTLTADPAAKIRIALMNVKDDTKTEANRLTTPTGTDGSTLTFVDDNVDLVVPGNQLEAQSAIGIWVEQALNANEPAIKSTYTLRISGTSI